MHPTSKQPRPLRWFEKVAVLLVGGVLAIIIEECQPHPVRDAVKQLTELLEHFGHRFETDKRFRENTATLLINVKLLGRPKADLVPSLGQPIAVQTHTNGRLVFEKLTFPSLHRPDEKVTVECVDGLIGTFNPPIQIRRP